MRIGLGKRLKTGLAVTALSVALSGAVQAQSVFEAVIRVNDQAITQYELDQRTRMMQLFRAPGDPAKVAREQLIEDRLKLDAARANGIVIEESEIDIGIDEFASRNNMTGEQMLRALKGSGVDENSMRDFVRAGISWREVTRAKFVSRVSVSEADLVRAKAAVDGRDGIRVLVSELIMPAPPPQAAAVMERANRISTVKTAADFSAAARKYSAAATRVKGGRLEWMPITDLPPGLRSIILNLSPGEVSDPLPIQGAVALFQLRDIEEMSTGAPQYEAIEYAIYYIGGGRSEASLKAAAQIKARIDTCDDLYGIAKGQPPEVLQRESQAPDQIPQDIRYELAKLDDGEVSYNLTTADGQTLMLIMMCGRTPQLVEGGPSEEDLTDFVRNERIDAYADGYLEQLRSEARIVEK